MIGWHQRLNGHESEQISRDNEGQGSLMCFRPWGYKESGMRQLLNNNNKTNLFLTFFIFLKCALGYSAIFPFLKKIYKEDFEFHE